MVEDCAKGFSTSNYHVDNDSDVMITGIVSPCRELIFSTTFAELAQSRLNRLEAKKLKNQQLLSSNNSMFSDPSFHSVEISSGENIFVDAPGEIIDLTDDGKEWERDGCTSPVFQRSRQMSNVALHETDFISQAQERNLTEDSHSYDNVGKPCQVKGTEGKTLNLTKWPDERLDNELTYFHEGVVGLLMDMSPSLSDGEKDVEVDSCTAFPNNSELSDFKSDMICNKSKMVKEGTNFQPAKGVILKTQNDRHVDFCDELRDDSNIIWCSDCGRRCSDKGRSSLHRGGDSEIKSFLCKKCKMKLSNDKEFELQSKLPKVEKEPLSKDACKSNEKTGCWADRHQTRASWKQASDYREMNGTQSEVQCKECGRMFKSVGGFKRHWRWKHTERQEYKCNDCGVCFKHCSESIEHIETHIRGKPVVVHVEES